MALRRNDNEDRLLRTSPFQRWYAEKQREYDPERVAAGAAENKATFRNSFLRTPPSGGVSASYSPRSEPAPKIAKVRLENLRIPQPASATASSPPIYGDQRLTPSVAPTLISALPVYGDQRLTPSVAPTLISALPVYDDQRLTSSVAPAPINSLRQRPQPITLTNDGVTGDVEAFRAKEVADRTAANAANASLRSRGLIPRMQNPDGSLQVGNLDVSFAPGTSQADAAAFMRDPVRPTAQINRRQGGTGLVRPNYDWNPSADVQANDGLFTRANSSDMDWQERRAYNTQILANQQDREAAGLTYDASLRKNAIEQAQAINEAQMKGQELALKTEDSRSLRSLREAQAINEAQMKGQELALKTEDSRSLRSLREAQTGEIMQGKPVYGKRETVGKGGVTEQPYVIRKDENGNEYVEYLQEKAPALPPQVAAAAAQRLTQAKTSNDPNLAAMEQEYLQLFGKLPY